jgi:pyruvate kinase
MNRKARIVATIGPTSQDPAILKQMIHAGMNVARLNFSHGTYAQHAENISVIRKLSSELNQPIAILQDLQGPKIRIGEIPGGSLEVHPGDRLTIGFTKSILPDPNMPGAQFTIPFPELQHKLKPGGKVLLDDGNLEFTITEITTTGIIAEVVLGGVLTSRKGFTVPGVDPGVPGFTEKDKTDLHFGLDQKVDLVAISFVKTASDVTSVREEIQRYTPEKVSTPIIAKLERQEALNNLDTILDVADGVMVARGDLGIEMPPAAVPIAQKNIIRAANFHSKPVITATQMLDSMIHNPRPTRAETTDVANAIFDGTDAVMLSGETASGKYPVESIRMMDAIVLEAEKNYAEWSQCDHNPDMDTTEDAIAMTRAARELAHDRNVSAIAVFTHSGRTALLMSKARPQVPVLAFTPTLEAYQRMALYWGVTPYLVPYVSSVESMIQTVDETLIATTSISDGQQVVLISGFPIAHKGKPNLALLHTIGEQKK